MTRAATRARHGGPETTPEPPKTNRKCRALIGNDMHSPASASPLATAISIFLIGNEFQLQRASFRHLFAGQLSKHPTGEAPQRRGFLLLMRFLNSNRVNMGN